LIRALCIVWGVLASAVWCAGQSAPRVQNPANASPGPLSLSSSEASPQSEWPSPSTNQTQNAGIRLSLKDAEALALKNNPAISVARLSALASEQVTREARSNLWPQAYANLTAVDAQNNSRITAGGLNNPIVSTRAAGELR
jgi:outer membrane protein TolC